MGLVSIVRAYIPPIHELEMVMEPDSTYVSVQGVGGFQWSSI